MNQYGVALVAFLSGLAFGLAPLSIAEDKQEQKELDAAAVPAGVSAGLRTLRSDGYWYRVYERAGTIQVGRSRIPDKVIGDADAWIKRLVRPERLPEDTAAKLTGETREMKFVPPQEVDFLRLEYSKGDETLCIVEGAGNIFVLWHGPEIKVGDKPDEDAVALAKKVLSFPDGVSPQLTASLEPLTVEGTTLLLGHVKAPRPREQKYPSWYHGMDVWLAPGYLYLVVPESTGEPPERLQAQPGIRPRFTP